MPTVNNLITYVSFHTSLYFAHSRNPLIISKGGFFFFENLETYLAASMHLAHWKFRR